MTDRELLKAAAKAAGIVIDKSSTNGGGRNNTGFDLLGNAVLDWHNCTTWNPLTDDGDALRLAVKLRFHVNMFSADSSDGIQTPGFVEIWSKDTDPLHVEYVEGAAYEAATRRAIVRAAAAMGDKS